jgi:hypothetical protein
MEAFVEYKGVGLGGFCTILDKFFAKIFSAEQSYITCEIGWED